MINLQFDVGIIANNEYYILNKNILNWTEPGL